MLYDQSPDALFVPTRSIDPIGYGKVAIVTGCASGIGLACAQLLLAHQFQVCGLDVQEFDYGLVREADHGRFHFHKTDLTEPEACEHGVRVCLSSFGCVSLILLAPQARDVVFAAVVVGMRTGQMERSVEHRSRQRS